MPHDDLVRMAEKAARGGLFLFVGNALSIVILAVGSIVIARLLGPSNYGLYTLSMLMPLLFVSLADAGMNSALIRIPARLRSEGDYPASNRAIRLGFLLKLALSVTAFLICYFGADIITITLLNRPGLVPYLRLAGVLIIVQAVFDAATNCFIGLDLMQYSASTQVIYSVLKSVLSPVLILLGFGITGAIAAYVLSIFLAGVVGAVILFKKNGCARTTGTAIAQHVVKLSTLLDYSLPLYVAMILAVFVTQYQNLVLAHFASDVQIGNFNAAWNFNSLLSILIYPISISIFPMFSKMSTKTQRIDLARGFMLAVKYASLILIPASIAIMVFSKDLVYLTYGRGYALAPQYLVIVSALYLLAGLGSNVIGSFLNGVAATRTVLKIDALTLAIYLPLGPALTWLWGPYGLLIAFILSNATSTLYAVRKVSVSFDAHPDLAASARIFLASLVAGAPSVVLVRLDVAGIGWVNLITGGCLYLFVYLTMIPILGAIRLQDINNMETMLCKTQAVAILLRPILAYEARILSALSRN